MAKVLYIEASPGGDRSHSVAVARAFLDVYRKRNPKDEIQRLNVFEADLIPFDGRVVAAKYTILHGKKHTVEERQAWDAVEKVIDEFKAADKYVIAAPMWNFGVPYRLKQYIDILLQPGYTFSYTPEKGYEGLVTGKPAFCAFARGGEYPADSDAATAYDHQKPYMELILRFIGFTDIRSVVIEPTLMQGPGVAQERRQAAIDKAKKIAEEF